MVHVLVFQDGTPLVTCMLQTPGSPEEEGVESMEQLTFKEGLPSYTSDYTTLASTIHMAMLNYTRVWESKSQLNILLDEWYLEGK